MRLNGLDLNLLVALNALLAERNISRAARRIYLSQPAMSNALARLRAWFDDPLLIRAGRRMMLTARAETLVAPVREILMRIESTVATPPAFDPATSTRQFTLVGSDYTAIVLIQPLVQLLAHEAPGIRLKLLTQHGPDPITLLEEGAADLLIQPERYLARSHPSLRLFTESYVCVTWKGSHAHRLPLTLKDYRAAGHVVAQYGDGRLPALETWLMESRGFKRREEVITHNLALQADFVVGTDRIATMHRRLARRVARHLPVRISAPPLRIPALTECAQWHRARAEDPGLRWLIDSCSQVAAKL
jgi:LysR family transcriptional regulator, nod-box dependent transcriptional activator